MDTLDKLRAWGCDVDDAMARFLDDRELYLSCLEEVIADPAFEKLGSELRAGRAGEAFESAYSLKGVLGNMSLTPLYELDVALVEPLRRGEADGLLPLYGRLMSAREKLIELVRG